MVSTLSRDMSDYCMLFSQTLYGLLFSYLTITDVTSYVDHTVHLTKSLLQTVLQYSYHKKITLARFACLCFVMPSLLTKQLNGVFLTWVHFILRAAALNREQR